jgi:signal transduction histidine kinase
MTMTKRLDELHGREMMVQIKPEVGSTFSFTIPKKRPLENRRKTGPLPGFD